MSPKSKKIESLTPEQELALKAYHAECMAIGTSTERADRARAEGAIRKMYAAIGKREPIFIWCQSPATCILGKHVLEQWLKKIQADETAKRVEVRASLGASLGDSLWDSLRASLWASLGDSLRASLWASLWASLRASLRASLGDSLRASLRASLGDSLNEMQWANLWGQQEQYWIGFYRFMELHLKIEYTPQSSERLGWWQDIASSVNWWFPYENFCFVSDRPTFCSIDADRRLHCEDRAAMEFGDGWKVWAWHGVRVPQFAIEDPDSITAKHVKDEENTEVRRCLVERMGWERFCESAKMSVLHEDELHTQFPAIPVSDKVEPHVRLVTSYRAGIEKAQLLEASDLTDFEERPLRFVRLSDPSTDRKYTIRVPHHMTRCYEAVGWTFGMTEEQYRSVVQHS